MILIKILKTPKLLLVSLLSSFIIFISSFSFYDRYYKLTNAIKTWNNCESNSLVFDKRSFNENCYIYYKDKISFDLNDSNDTIFFRVEAYQFMENVNYNSKSLLNEKNVAYGKYKDLKGNEIAIPKSLAKKYAISINDKLYYEHNEYNVSFIFQDLYNIKEADINSLDNVIFIGTNNLLSDNYLYAAFKNDSGIYNEVYGFAKIKQSFINDVKLYGICEFIIICFSSTLIYLLLRKQFSKELIRINNSGCKKRYYLTLLGVNFYLICLPSIVSFIVLAIKEQIIHASILLGSSIFTYLVLTILYKNRTRRG